jgi:hypothetical protein
MVIKRMRIKTYKFGGLTLIYLMLLSFATNSRTYQTECISLESDGYIAVKIWDTSKGAKYNTEQARKDAIHAILNVSEEQNKFKNIEKSFFAKNGKWTMFTRSAATETTLPASLGAKNWKVYQVSISKNELRKYLEEQKIIKSLTNGF